jgi:hypothetical protein
MVRNLRRVIVASAILGAAVGGTIATLANPKSGPTFWLDLAVGACIGAVCLPLLAEAGGLAAAHLRHHSETRPR